MERTIELTDLSSMLEVVERSAFNHFTLKALDTRISATRFRAAETEAGKEAHRSLDVVGVRAPRIGLFHSEASVGSHVEADTVIGRIATFRTTTSVKAGQAGTLAALLVRDGGFVEYGQSLARIELACPEGAA